jgi:hypothetical protein
MALLPARSVDSMLLFNHSYVIVVIVDRWASHRHNEEAEKWNKMALPIFEHPRAPHFFQPARRTLLDRYSISSVLRERPKVVYIDRQSTDRHLRHEDHEDLVAMLGDLNRTRLIEFDHVVLENMTTVAQVEVIADAQVRDS